MNNAHYCLTEDWSPDADLPSDCVYVALTQQAISQFEKHGVPFILLEDFYTSGEIRGDTDQFLNEQLEWFDTFDNHIQKLYPDAARLELKLASLYYYYIKYAVDNVILTVRVLDKFISANDPLNIIFISREAQSDELEHILSFRNMESTYSLLIESFCTAHHIGFKRITLHTWNTGLGECGPGNLYSGQKRCVGTRALKEKVKGALRKGRDFYYNFTKLRPPLFSKKAGCVRILLLHTTDFIYDFCLEASRYGFEFYVLEDNKIIKYDSFSTRKILTIDRTFRRDVEEDEIYKKGAATSEIARLYAWINDHCKLQVQKVLQSRIDKFIDEICVEIISLVPGFIKFYKEHNIDYVLTYSIWTIADHAAIAAVQQTPDTAGVGFAHGTDAFEAKSRFFKIFRLFDYLFVATREEAEHERNLVAEFNKTVPRVATAKYFRNKYKRSPGFLRRFNIRLPTDKPIIVFVPIMCVPWPHRPIELTQPFPMEYLKWHKALANYMASRPDYFFIWKGLYQPNQSFDYMADYIANSNFSNLSFQSGKLNRWLAVAHKVICDSPSTAFFEAIFSNVPVLSLYRPQDQRLRQNASIYGKGLAPYSSIEEGMSRVDTFLNTDPETLHVSISYSQTDVPALLKSALLPEISRNRPNNN